MSAVTRNICSQYQGTFIIERNEHLSAAVGNICSWLQVTFVRSPGMGITHCSASILPINKPERTSMNYLHEKIILVGMIPKTNEKTGTGERILLGGFDRMQATFVDGS